MSEAKELTVATDWQGRPIPEGETPETIIKWWELEGYRGNDIDLYWIRSWQEMVEFAESQLVYVLESEEAQSGEEVTVKFRLRTGTLAAYQEVANYEE